MPIRYKVKEASWLEKFPVSMSSARENRACRASIKRSYVYAQGTFKNVYMGRYTEGSRAGEQCVCKIFKSGSVYEDSYFEHELLVVNKAIEVVNNYNQDGIIDKFIWINKPEIWSFVSNGEMHLLEPFIANFEKFNSNTGWTPDKSSPWIDVMQALSHYSYHISNGKSLLCDIQGGYYKDGFIITDPVIMSNKKEYGPSDLGAKGISTFFARHQCTQYCKSYWIRPKDDKIYFQEQKGSSMLLLPTCKSRVAMTGQFSRIFPQKRKLEALAE